MHPIFKDRLNYLEFLNRRSMLNAPDISIQTAGVFGSHTEFRLLDEALKALEIKICVLLTWNTRSKGAKK